MKHYKRMWVYLFNCPYSYDNFRGFMRTNGQKAIKCNPSNNILYFLVNDSSMISPLFYLHIGGQTPAPFYLAPNLAVRYGFIRLGGVPSYLIRVWPGRQGHHVVHTGLL